MKDIGTQAGLLTLEFCSLVEVWLAASDLLRWSHGREHRRRNLQWSIAPSNNVWSLEDDVFNNLSSVSCLIDEGETFLLTGGSYSEEVVSRYNIDGWVEDLDNLNTGRYSHGCAKYTNNDGERVSIYLMSKSISGIDNISLSII